VLAGWAGFRGFFAFVNVSAIAAFPVDLVIALEILLITHKFPKLHVAFIVAFFNF
jgi:hypothetical protein